MDSWAETAEVVAIDGVDMAVTPGGRVLRAAGADGRSVFVKNFGAEGVAFGRRLHIALSACLPAGIWSASPPAGAAALMEREWRKSAAFRAAGIPVPDLAPAGPVALAATDAGPDSQATLKRMREAGDTTAHDALLISLAASLGEIHAAGLCHGRPHPRDTAPDGAGGIVWFDFEEEPEAAMPLLEAQVRDLWLLFLQVCQRALGPETPARALIAYRASAPAPVAARLAVHLGRVAWTLTLGRLLLRLHDGGDLRRYVEATTALRAILHAPAPHVPAWDGGESLPTA